MISILSVGVAFPDLSDAEFQILVTFKLWAGHEHALRDNMIVRIRGKAKGSRVVFLQRKGNKAGQVMAPESTYFMAGRTPFFRRKLIANPSRALGKSIQQLW